MADDVAVTAGVGTAIATQDRSSRHFQQVIPAGGDTIASGRVNVTSTAAEAIAARSNREYVILMALASNTDVIDVGDTSVAHDADFPLAPGASITIPTEDAIWADTGTGTQVLAYIEVYD